ncbi:hypothetical protein [Celeribacter sp.]|uniref:hypothetical protein n=1 Tax=Celeribacter sp. TaxID=1890673 RepID=UPI003A942FD7
MDEISASTLMLLGLSRQALIRREITPARPLVQVKRARHLIARHIKNQKPVIAGFEPQTVRFRAVHSGNA